MVPPQPGGLAVVDEVSLGVGLGNDDGSVGVEVAVSVGVRVGVRVGVGVGVLVADELFVRVGDGLLRPGCLVAASPLPIA
jgi:hypothetical protein